MQRELEKYILRCDSLEMQRFIREMNEKELLTLYNESGVYAKRKFEGNVTKRMQAYLQKTGYMQPSSEDVLAVEMKALRYFQSEDFSEYHNIKLKVALSVIKTMRRKNFHEKYIKTFLLAKYEAKTIVENVDRSWYDIFLFEEKYGFPKDSIIPYLESHKVKLCVVIKEKEYVIGELICFSSLTNMMSEEELIHLAILAKAEAMQNGESDRLPKNHELKSWQIVFKKAYEMFRGTEFENNWLVIYKNMDKIGREMIAREIILEGSVINFWLQAGTYLQFIFYKEHTLADVVDPYKYRRYWVINERAIEEDDFRALEFWPMVGRERNVIGRPLRLNNPEYKDMYFETINGV